MKTLKQAFFLTIISEFLLIVLTAIIASFHQSIAKSLTDFPAAIILAIPIYFIPDFISTAFYFYVTKYLIVRYPVLKNRARRMAISLLSFLILSLILITIFYLWLKIDKSIQYSNRRIGDFIIPALYWPTLIVANEFIYPKWFG